MKLKVSLTISMFNMVICAYLKLLAQFKLFGPPAVLFFKQGKQLQGNTLIREFSKNDFIKQLIALKGI